MTKVGEVKRFCAVPAILAAAVGLIVLAGGCEKSPTPPTPPLAVDSLTLYRQAFADPTECAGCHPNHYQEWQQSMHAYAFTDPIFFTLNAIGQQRSGNQLDQFCIKCHSPFATLLQEAPPGFNPNALSSLARNGLHCDACHTMKSFERGKAFKTFHLDRVRRGPISDPQPNSYHGSAFDDRFIFSDFCSACHDVKSPDGQVLLEATNTEWDNSPYLAMGLHCQDCHMPAYRGQAALGGPLRDNVHRHTFTGVDYPLVDFPGKDETIARVRELLENSVTMAVSAPAQVAAGGGFSIEVNITNDRTGHNVPSGTIFERQMWIEIVVKDAISGAEYFASGLPDPNGDLRNHHSEYVSNGQLSADSALALFNGTPIDQNGHETLFFWEARSVENRTIAPFETRSTIYSLTAPAQPGTLEVSVRLRFRSFPPYLLRAIGEDALLPNLLIFDMETENRVIAVTN